MRIRGCPATVTGSEPLRGFRLYPGARDSGCHLFRTSGEETREGLAHGDDRGQHLSVRRHRGDGGPEAGPAAQRGVSGHRRRPGPRREGHREVDHGPRAGRAAAAGACRPRLPVLVRSRRARPRVSRGAARFRRSRGRTRAPSGHAGRTAGRGHRGPPGRLARHRARADRGHDRLPARPARRGPPRGSVRRWTPLPWASTT